MSKFLFCLSVFLIMPGYQSTALADCKAGLTVKTLAEGVRQSELVAGDTCKVVSSRIELYDKSNEKWFEAEKVGDTYKLTVKGKNDRQKNLDADMFEGKRPSGC